MARPYQKGLTQVADGVWAYLQPDGGWGWSNAGLVADDDQTLLVDTLFDVKLTADMLETMRASVPAARRIGTVVNTHANGDHCWGNELVADARIVASARCAEEMAELPPSRLADLIKAAPAMGPAGRYLTDIFGAFDFGSVTLTPPNETFTGELEVSVGGRAVRLIEVGPAHTRGDVIVHLPGERVVFTGDILFNGGHPIVWAGPISNWVAACRLIADLDVDTVVPGHGPVTGKAAVAALAEYLGWVWDGAGRRREAGMSALEAARDLLAEVKGSTDLAWAGWGESERLAVNVAAVYRELGAEPGSAGPAGLFGDMADLAGYGR